ncbi:hypothetical protein FJZ33_00635 [Candidatus Poribacteria bacterium]|nr:hypothetical protein [Candidatus Poribacteria bacterium]
MKLEARIPVRIDFGGPWTDTPEFYENEIEGGATLNAAIVPLLLNATGQYNRAYVRGTLITGKSLLDAEEIKVNDFSGTIKKKLVQGTSVSYEAGIPSSGLGTSAALNAIWLGLIKGVNEDISSHELRQLVAEKSHRIERELGIIGGKQDQYAAVFGGINLFVFHRDGRVDIQKVPISKSCLKELESSLILFDTGKTRLSSKLHEHVWGNYRKGSNRSALVRMREIALEMFDSLTQGNLELFGKLMNENWECQKALHPSITNEHIEDIFNVVKSAGISGGKACGAGGGGCLVFLSKPEYRKRIENILMNLSGVLVPFEFDWDGLVIENDEMDVIYK